MTNFSTGWWCCCCSCASSGLRVIWTSENSDSDSKSDSDLRTHAQKSELVYFVLADKSQLVHTSHPSLSRVLTMFLLLLLLLLLRHMTPRPGHGRLQGAIHIGEVVHDADVQRASHHGQGSSNGNFGPHVARLSSVLVLQRDSLRYVWKCGYSCCDEWTSTGATTLHYARLARPAQRFI